MRTTSSIFLATHLLIPIHSRLYVDCVNIVILRIRNINFAVLKPNNDQVIITANTSRNTRQKKIMRHKRAFDEWCQIIILTRQSRPFLEFPPHFLHLTLQMLIHARASTILLMMIISLCYH